MDYQSLMGYATNSPFRNNPYLDINTPQGLITMEDTPHDILGIDNLGNAKKMKAGRKKPYKFDGTQVREIPMNLPPAEQANPLSLSGSFDMDNGRISPTLSLDYNRDRWGVGADISKGNIGLRASLRFQRGGYNLKNLYDFIYEDEDEDSKDMPIAPTEEDLPPQEDEGQQQGEDDNQLAMDIAFGDFSSRNPYYSSQVNQPRSRGVNPYLQKAEQDILGNYEGVSNLGIWGDKAHQQRQSDHNTGDAQDFGVSDPNIASQIINKLQNEPKVKYIIYNGRIWNPSLSKDWRKYTGPDPHSTHIHVSYNR